MGFIDDTPLKVIDGVVRKLEHEINNLKVAILQMSCLKKIMYKKLNTKI